MRYVFIGGPSTGKTTVIKELHSRGFSTIDETARRLLEDSSIVKPTIDRDTFQKEVFKQQLLAEREHEALEQDEAPCFLDGGIFDGCAYYLCDGMPIPPMFDTVSGARYRRAFLFEKLDRFVHDGVRYQQEEFVTRITEAMEHCYSQRGVEVTRVPNLSVNRRTEFILALVAATLPSG